jgi:hypothetical protein
MQYRLWYMQYGLWYMQYGLWYMQYGLWYMQYRLWYMHYGLWYKYRENKSSQMRFNKLSYLIRNRGKNISLSPLSL